MHPQNQLFPRDHTHVCCSASTRNTYKKKGKRSHINYFPTTHACLLQRKRKQGKHKKKGKDSKRSDKDKERKRSKHKKHKRAKSEEKEAKPADNFGRFGIIREVGWYMCAL